MGVLMARLRFVLMGLLLMGSASLIKADGIPIDPLMDVTDPPCFEGCPNPVAPGQAFQFTVGADGGGIFTFTNQSGILWKSLLFVVSGSGIEDLGLINCTSSGDPSPFASPCGKSFDPDGSSIDLFYNACPDGCIFPGIPDNNTITINLNDLTGATGGSWRVGTHMTGFYNGDRTLNVPEPATLTLLGLGIGALFARRKFRVARNSEC